MPKTNIPRSRSAPRWRSAPNAATPLPDDSLAAAMWSAAGLVAGVLSGRSLAALESGPLAPAVRDLAYGTLRDYGRGDWLLARLARRPPEDPRLRALLLVALQRLERRPQDAHTIVDQAVAAAGCLANGALRGFSNAVLRNFLRQRATLTTQADADEVARWRHPRWWLERLRVDHPAEWADIAGAGNSRGPLALRVNRRRADPAAMAAELAAAGLTVERRGDAGLLCAQALAVADLPGFALGRLSVQDLGAQRAALLLDAAPGVRVLDACAAPGGKAAHILERAEVRLTALDVDARRCATLRDNLDRLGLVADVRPADCRATQSWWDGRPFECILADVPCSASGVVRRHPDAKWLRREQDISHFAREQAAILEALWPLLAVGGKLLYATCSVFAAENGRQVDAFMARHADALALDDASQRMLLPQAEHDGFYYALIGKRQP